jgi:hypothetical protein
MTHSISMNLHKTCIKHDHAIFNIGLPSNTITIFNFDLQLFKLHGNSPQIIVTIFNSSSQFKLQALN